MTIRPTVDRFEGDKKQVAVLLSDGGQITAPKKVLTKGVEAGDILSFPIEKGAEAARQVADQTRAVQEELKEAISPLVTAR